MSPRNQHCIFQSWQYRSISRRGPTLPMAPVKAPKEPPPLAAQVPQGDPAPPSRLVGPVMLHSLSLTPSTPSWGFAPHHCEHRPDSLINSQAHVSTRKNSALTPLPAYPASSSCPFPVPQFPCLQTHVPWGETPGPATGMRPAESDPQTWPCLETSVPPQEGMTSLSRHRDSGKGLPVSSRGSRIQG